ncbi:MAG: hypothetical protein JWQ38_3012, partial [Flavipsychrobacter sp.]|nr:hypothetical protein [Flavipsychrobacter sp.]
MKRTLARICCLSLICFAITHVVNAQQSSPWTGVGIEANVFAGKVIKHTKKFHLPVPDLSTGADINFQWSTYGKKEWHQRRRYPLIGIGFTYTNYGIDSIYGRCFSLY